MTEIFAGASPVVRGREDVNVPARTVSAARHCLVTGDLVSVCDCGACDEELAEPAQDCAEDGPVGSGS